MRSARLRSLLASRPGAPVGFFVATWALLSVVRVHATIHLDTARDLLLARDCAVAGACGAGPPTSFAGWTQGALWSHVLVLREQLGLGLGALEELARCALALAAALVPLAARALGRSPNALTWALWFGATIVTIGYPTLWNPTLLPLASGLFTAALLHAARTGGALMFTAAAVALAAAIDLHVVAASLVPLLLATVTACAMRPIVAVAGATAALIAALAVSSPVAFAMNWPTVVGQAPALAAVAIGAAIVGAAARRRLAGRDGQRRAGVVAVALCLHAVALLLVLAASTGHPLHARYLAPIVACAAILVSTRSAGRRPRAWVRGVGVMVVLSGYAALAFGVRVLNPSFRLLEVERIAGVLYARGGSYGALYRHLRGPDAVGLLATLAALEPREHRPSVADEHDLLVVRTTRQMLAERPPADWIVVELGAGNVAVIVPYLPWVRPGALEICGATAEQRCVAAPLAADALEQRPGMRRADRAYPSLLADPRIARGQRVSYRLPLASDRVGPARRIHLWPDRCEGWRVARDGDPEGGPSLRIEPDDGERALVFTVVSGPRCRWWLPPFVEVPEGDAELAALVAAVTARHTR